MRKKKRKKKTKKEKKEKKKKSKTCMLCATLGNAMEGIFHVSERKPVHRKLFTYTV
jgi:hypothetical protein